MGLRHPVGYVYFSFDIYESCNIHESCDMCVHMQRKIDELLASTREHTQIYVYLICGMYGSYDIHESCEIYFTHFYIYIYIQTENEVSSPQHVIAHMYIFIVPIAYISRVTCMS